MKYLIFNTKEEAESYSHDEAVRHNRGRENDVIQFWWTIRETADNKWAVQCPDGNINPNFPEAVI